MMKIRMKNNKKIMFLTFLIVSLALFGISGCNSRDIPEVAESDNVDSSDYETNEEKAEEESKDLKEFNECLAENGMVIYGSRTCPACIELIETLGGYEAAKPVYIECTEERQICQKETKTNYVPEIQINREIYDGQRTQQGFSEATGCHVP